MTSCSAAAVFAGTKTRPSNLLRVLRLEGTKIILRGGRNEDITPLYRYISDPAVQQYLAIVPPKDEKTFGESLRHMIVGERDYFFIIAKKADNEAVGLIRMNWNTTNIGEVAYWLGRPYWGRGLAAEALGKVGIFAFAELGLEALIAHVFAGNARSLALLQKLGFEAMNSHELVSEDPLKSHEIELRVERHAFLWADPAQVTPGDLRLQRRGPATPETPMTESGIPRPDVKVLREKLGLTQEQFSMRFRLPLSTIQAWERGDREPSEVASVLLFAISRDPAGIERALQ